MEHVALLLVLLCSAFGVGRCFFSVGAAAAAATAADDDDHGLKNRPAFNFDPGDRMVDWRQLLSRRSAVEKRPMNAVDESSLETAFPDLLKPDHLQDWSAQFGRNYRTFGGDRHHRRLPLSQGAANADGGLASTDPLMMFHGDDDLQNWRNLYSRQRKRATKET